MTTSTNALYSPALRMKGGELAGLRNLATEFADRICPRLIVPPPAERDETIQSQLFASETFPDISSALKLHWAGRPALVEATYLVGECGRNRMGLWLPKMFEKARSVGGHPVPLVTLEHLLEGPIDAYRSSVGSAGSLKFSVVVSSGDLADQELIKRGIGVIEKIGLSPQDCGVIADFHDADFADPDIVAPIIAGVLETLQAVAPWLQVIFQGTNYPEQNPAKPGECCLVPRNEWIAWRRAVKFEPETGDHMIFGDYAADCSKINFEGRGGIPIPHQRYAISESWLVSRGPDQGQHFETMRKVCEAIIASGNFAERDFSAADEYIYQMSKGSSRPGGAREWRAANTTHHITRVVSDIGLLLGQSFPRRKPKDVGVQLNLLPD